MDTHFKLYISDIRCALACGQRMLGLKSKLHYYITVILQIAMLYGPY